MTASYLDSKRISGDAADIQVSSGGWKELGRTTLGSAADPITVSSLTDKRYYMILHDTSGTTTANFYMRYNNDSGSNYSARISDNDGAEILVTSQNKAHLTGSSDAFKNFGVTYVANMTAKEKLAITHGVDPETAGAATVPTRFERVHKWSNTAAAINSVDVTTTSPTQIIGSEVVVLGWDESDTHSTNFWEELASVDISTGTTSTTGTFTAKKYLWVQVYMNSSSIAYDYTFNSDTGSNYAYRKSTNGGSDGTTASDSVFLSNHGFDSNPHYDNFFIVNNSANEKLVIGNRMSQGTAGAGSAPNRQEIVGKWANTSSQITSIQMDNAGTNFTRCIMKVWGSD